MNTIQITIKTDSSAFEPEPGPELARILRRVAEMAENYGPPIGLYLYDINNIEVGKVSSK